MFRVLFVDIFISTPLTNIPRIEYLKHKLYLNCFSVCVHTCIFVRCGNNFRFVSIISNTRQLFIYAIVQLFVIVENKLFVRQFSNKYYLRHDGIQYK